MGKRSMPTPPPASAAITSASPSTRPRRSSPRPVHPHPRGDQRAQPRRAAAARHAANSRRICFCTDDRPPADLLASGSIDHMVRGAIAFGIDPIKAISHGDAEHGRVVRPARSRAIAPGRGGPVRLRSAPLAAGTARVPGGRLVAEGGQMLPSIARSDPLCHAGKSYILVSHRVGSG